MVFNKTEICVLIPVFNEEKHIAAVISQVLDLGYHVLAVDDGSTDSTPIIISHLPVSLIQLKNNQGKGAAIQKGMDWILNRGFRAFVIMDGDGQHEPKEISRFVDALEKSGADMLVGNRMSDPDGMSFLRQATNKCMSWIISCIAHQKIPDTQCGFRAMTVHAASKIRLSCQRFEVESEMLLLAASQGLKIASIPVASIYRDEVSHIHPVRDTIRFFKFLFSFLRSR